ncbi:ROK family transcriptional regulator [Bacillus sp. FJAT-49732]|uniref:ROK family transcriptional regulator n=1 Tax=Lederbergia citrisecunda TaxID=2833583 RepID=A0A942TNL5_9BACI|nr:ROK family transcriptional regulator [Lederbergia citrisecunda]MBS4200875.1 ROK family transcriptional regulator [Lederbergia citrisecunda]
MKYTTSEKEILSLVSMYNGISRKQLAEISDLSQASITKITKKLIDEHFIFEGERISSGLGRKEVLLYSNPKKFTFLGIDIGGYTVRFALSDNSMKILHQEEFFMAELDEYPNKGEALLERLLHFLESLNTPLSMISAIGIGVTGLVDRDQKTILNIPNRKGWDDIEIVNIFKQTFLCPIFLDEGGRTMAIAEKNLGKAREVRDFIVVQIGFGIVSGIMINDQLLRGSSNVSSLLGHITADEKAGRCLCGNYGCLENIITFPMLEIEYKKRNGQYSSIVEAYERNDKVAIEICIDTGKALGIALSNVVNLFNPTAIYIGGPIFDSLPMLLEETKRTIILRANRFATLALSLEENSFGQQQGIIGALTFAKINFISDLKEAASS